jgi:hypothetical protein
MYVYVMYFVITFLPIKALQSSGTQVGKVCFPASSKEFTGFADASAGKNGKSLLRRSVQIGRDCRCLLLTYADKSIAVF